MKRFGRIKESTLVDMLIVFTDDGGYPDIHYMKTVFKKDLKVRFDTENVEYCKCDDETLTGFHTLENGLTFLGVFAYGDWEDGIFFIIYWTGIRLKAYIPKGVPFNDDKMETFGNDNESDIANCRKKYPNFQPDVVDNYLGEEEELYPSCWTSIDWNEVKEDLLTNFKERKNESWI